MAHGQEITAEECMPELGQGVFGILRSFSEEHHLTRREEQVFVLMCTGRKNSMIANRLGLSEATIRLHITNLHRKLGTGGKADFLHKVMGWYLPRNGHAGVIAMSAAEIGPTVSGPGHSSPERGDRPKKSASRTGSRTNV